jgi:DnaJ-class molecular chaperone
MDDKLKVILIEYTNALNKILKGSAMTQMIKVTRKCRICGGYGTNPDRPGKICHTCKGKGEYTVMMKVKEIKFIN